VADPRRTQHGFCNIIAADFARFAVTDPLSLRLWAYFSIQSVWSLPPAAAASVAACLTRTLSEQVADEHYLPTLIFSSPFAERARICQPATGRRVAGVTETARTQVTGSAACFMRFREKGHTALLQRHELNEIAGPTAPYVFARRFDVTDRASLCVNLGSRPPAAARTRRRSDAHGATGTCWATCTHPSSIGALSGAASYACST
jgi:hypothetical protein